VKGCWVMVCGPSGAGKDSVLAWAEAALEQHPVVRFARRLVTRAAHPGSEHEEISRSAFQSLREGGGLAWHWQAHGFDYGVRKSYADDVAAGRVVVVNGSREHLLGLAQREDVRRMLVTAPPALLRARLDARGREGPEAVTQRLARNAALAPPGAEVVIRNDAALEVAGAALRDYLLEVSR
jgi:ribose 1,5-bisphosphokinase